MNLLATPSVPDTRRRLSADLKLGIREELGVDEGTEVAVFLLVGVVRVGRFEMPEKLAQGLKRGFRFDRGRFIRGPLQAVLQAVVGCKCSEELFPSVLPTVVVPLGAGPAARPQVRYRQAVAPSDLTGNAGTSRAGLRCERPVRSWCRRGGVDCGELGDGKRGMPRLFPGHRLTMIIRCASTTQSRVS
jgi:hypothetical protein